MDVAEVPRAKGTVTWDRCADRRAVTCKSSVGQIMALRLYEKGLVVPRMGLRGGIAWRKLLGDEPIALLPSRGVLGGEVGVSCVAIQAEIKDSS